MKPFAAPLDDILFTLTHVAGADSAPDWDADIRCLPTCLGDDEAPRYGSVQAGPHLAAKFQATVQEPT